MKRAFGFLSVALILAALLGGCADPAKDKPEAEVGEPTAGGDHKPSGERYVFTNESTIGFVGSKVTGSHDGGFNTFEGEFVLVGKDPTKSRTQVTIDTASLWADNERLTGHLKSADFFDVETFKTASFTSTKIEREGESYVVTGNLDLHGVTKSIRFPAQINVANDRVTAKAEFVIMRFDFGIEYKGKADDLIRDEVVIKLDMVAVHQKDAAS